MNSHSRDPSSYALYPKVREDVVIVPQTVHGLQTYMIKDPVKRTYHRVGEMEYTIMTLLDGHSSFSQIQERFEEESGGAQLEANELEDFLRFLKEADHLERPRAEKNVLFYEKMKAGRKKKLYGGGSLKNIVEITFPAFDPNQLFDRIIEPLRFFWSRGFLLFSFACFFLAALIAYSDWGAFKDAMFGFYTFAGKGPMDYVTIYGIFFVIIGIHEFAHGLTCKHYGGEVHELGFVLYYFEPCFYCQVDDSYLFESKYHRIAVMIAGAYAELVLCSFAIFLWWLTPPHLFLHKLSGYVLAITGLVAVIFNFNPLMRYDGYYILADYLEVLNLREESFKYVGNWFKKRILKMPVELQDVSPRVRRVYATYGGFAVLYTGFVILLIFLMAKSFLVGRYHIWGIAALLVLVFLLFRKRVKKIWHALRELERSAKIFPYLKRHPILSVVGFAFLFYVLFILRMDWRITKDFVIEPKSRIEARSLSNGVIREVLVSEGDRVYQGQVVAILLNDSLQTRVVGLRNDLVSTSEVLRHASLAGDALSLQVNHQEKLRLEAELEEAERKLAALKISAPAAGTVLTPGLHEKGGIFIGAGEILCELADLSELQAKVYLAQWEVGDVRENNGAQLKVSSHMHAFHGVVERLSPQTIEGPTPVYEARLSTENSTEQLKPGMTGKAKITCGKVSFVGYLGRRVLRSLRAELWK